MQNMNTKNIIKYLLIGNLYSGKVVYEMINTKDPKIIYDINQIFHSYTKKRHIKPENVEIEGYYMSISLERIIMISKVDETLPMNQIFDLFNKINAEVPQLKKMSLDWSLILHKEAINSKINKIIDDFFTNLNKLNKNLEFRNTISFKNKKSFKINNMHNKYDKEQNILKQIRKGLISNNLDFDKFSFNNLIEQSNISINNKNSINENISININNKDKNKKNIKLIDDNDQEKTNLSKSLVRASLIANINNNKKSIANQNLVYSIMRELENLIWKISCCKKIIVVILIIIAIGQIIAIILLVKYSYSY